MQVWRLMWRSFEARTCDSEELEDIVGTELAQRTRGGSAAIHDAVDGALEFRASMRESSPLA